MQARIVARIHLLYTCKRTRLFFIFLSYDETTQEKGLAMTTTC